MYEYKAIPVNVHDGDTLTLHVDMGFTTWHHGSFRLNRCNARELNEPGGIEARDNLIELLLTPGMTILIRSYKMDKYGRYLAEIVMPDGTNLVDFLIEQQWAAPWDGTGTKPLPPWPRNIEEF